jgi:hypothetical protein
MSQYRVSKYYILGIIGKILSQMYIIIVVIMIIILLSGFHCDVEICALLGYPRKAQISIIIIIIIRDVYKNKAMGQAAVYEWFRHFKDQQLLDDDPQMGKQGYGPHCITQIVQEFQGGLTITGS